MTDASQEQSQTERQIQRKKWQNFADQLRHSVDAVEHSADRVYDETRQPGDPSSNGLKSPISDGQRSEFGTDPVVDEPSNGGMAEDGFEVVVKKKIRAQLRNKPMNGNVWSGTAANHLKELHSSSSSSSTTAAPHSGNSSSQSSKLRAASSSSTTTSNSKPQNRNLSTKNTPFVRSMEEGAQENEQDTSNSSDSAFAENQSPSHGSSTSLHFIGVTENQNFSDSVVALSDDEKWPELSVATRNDQTSKSSTSPASPKETETNFSTPPVEDKLEKDAVASNKRSKAPQWKKLDVDINYTKPSEAKGGSSKREPRSHLSSEHKSSPKHSVGSKRRPQSRKSNVSTSDVECQNNNETKKADNVDANNQPKCDYHQQDGHHPNLRRDNKFENGRNYRNNNGHRYDSHYNDYNRRIRNPRLFRHSVPNLFQCQPLPVYLMGHDYPSSDNFIQPLANTSTPYMYSPMGNVMMPTGYSEMNYANAQYLNDYGQQNIFQYQVPFVPMPLLPQNAQFVNTTAIPSSIPESVVPQEQQNGFVNTEMSLDDELSQLLKRVFIDDTDRSLKDLTDNPNILAQLNYYERCLLLRCQMQFYFSPDNLAKDHYLRNHMDSEGFVNLGLFSTFPRVKNLALDPDTIVNTLVSSSNFDLRINEQEVKVRARPQEWTSSSNNLNEHATPSTTVPSPRLEAENSSDAVANNDSTAQQKRSPQTTDEISADDIRARLSQGRLKQSLSDQKEELSPAAVSNSTENRQEEEPEDRWIVQKKKNRQSSSTNENDGKYRASRNSRK